jgi:hypothetical protein
MRPPLPSFLRNRLARPGHKSRDHRIAAGSLPAVVYDGAYAVDKHNREREIRRRRTQLANSIILTVGE